MADVEHELVGIEAGARNPALAHQQVVLVDAEADELRDAVALPDEELRISHVRNCATGCDSGGECPTILVERHGYAVRAAVGQPYVDEVAPDLERVLGAAPSLPLIHRVRASARAAGRPG